MTTNAFTICSWLWCGFLIVWLIWSFSAKPTQHREDISSRLSYVVLTVAGCYLMFAKDVPRDWLRIKLFSDNLGTAALGIALTTAGIALAIWARAYLGSNWSGTVTVKVGHELVRTGPYRWVRHPIYSGLILAMLGTALARREVRGLIAVLLLYAGFKIKSKIEEQTMVATFGSQYSDYARETGAILPRLRR